MKTTIILEPQNQQRRDHAVRVIGRLPLDKAWDVVIEAHVERRSTSQNRRLWALHKKAGDHLGYSAEDMHEFALCRYFGFSEQRATNADGEIISRHVPIKRSSARDVKEFAEFMEATESWYIAEFGVFLGDDE